jgi:hypothetical protein
MDCAVHAAAAEQRRVRRIYNRVHALLRDVAFHNFDVISHGLVLFHTCFRRRDGVNLL